jgi:hypothetical protein
VLVLIFGLVAICASRKEVSSLRQGGRVAKEIRELTFDGVEEGEDETFPGGVEDEVDGMVVVSRVTVQIDEKRRRKVSVSAGGSRRGSVRTNRDELKTALIA